MFEFFHNHYETKTALKHIHRILDKQEHKAIIELILRVLQKNSKPTGKMVTLEIFVDEKTLKISFSLASKYSEFLTAMNGKSILSFKAKIITGNVTKDTPYNKKIKNVFLASLVSFKIINAKIDSVELINDTILKAISTLGIEQKLD